MGGTLHGVHLVESLGHETFSMRAYLIRRVLLAVPTLMLVSVLVFSLMHLIPGDAVIARLQEVGVVTDASIAAVRRELGLDLSFSQQLGTWVGGLARGDRKSV